MRAIVLAATAAIVVAGCVKTDSKAVRASARPAATAGQAGGGAPYVLT